MNILYLILLGLSAHANFTDILELTRLKEKNSLTENTWTFGLALVMNKAGKPPVTLTIHNYLSRPEKEKAQLHKEIPGLLDLSNFLHLSEMKQEWEKGKQLEDLLVTKYSSPGEIKKIFRYLYQNDYVIDGHLLDRILGINYERTEKNITSVFPLSALISWDKILTQSWYEEIGIAFRLGPLKESDVFYDLGSGYGRVIFYGASVFPETKFKGIEIVSQRVEQTNAIAKMHSFNNVSFIANDVLNTDFSDGTCFFLFNPFPEILDTVLKRLEVIGSKKKIRIVTLHKPGEQLMHVPWLKLVAESQKLRQIRIFESKGP